MHSSDYSKLVEIRRPGEKAEAEVSEVGSISAKLQSINASGIGVRVTTVTDHAALRIIACSM